MPLSHEDEKELKQPFGLLIPDDLVTKKKISVLLKDAKKIIAVGDATTERLANLGIVPDLAVIDGKERRKTRHVSKSYVAKEMNCKNLPGGVSEAAVKLLKTALLENSPVRVLVEGEEDMLALPLFVIAPLGAIILYGQPLEGLVVVKLDKARRKKAKDLMDRIGLQK